MNLRRYFDRVVLINLKRRHDRLQSVQEALRQCHWPFRWPEIFEAVDGYANSIPSHFISGPGAWGCLLSHREILRQALADGVRNVLVLEDDVCFVDAFREQVAEFLRRVPDDWDQLMLGGQHVVLGGQTYRGKTRSCPLF